MYVIIERKNAETHIQNIVPKPPNAIARAIPPREPTPIFDERVIMRVSRGDMLFVFFIFRLFRTLINLNWGPFSFIVKYILFTRMRLIAIVQSILFIISMFNFMQIKRYLVLTCDNFHCLIF